MQTTKSLFGFRCLLPKLLCLSRRVKQHAMCDETARVCDEAAHSAAREAAGADTTGSLPAAAPEAAPAAASACSAAAAARQCPAARQCRVNIDPVSPSAPANALGGSSVVQRCLAHAHAHAHAHA